MRHFIRVSLAVLPLATAAPYSLNPRDGKPGCTSLSFGDFSWTIQDFTYNAAYHFTNPAHQVSSGSVKFNLTNPALPETVVCTADSTWLTDFFYGNINYDCKAAAGSTTKTSFAFSRPSGQLNVNQTWTCHDEDPQYPVTFRGYGTVNLTLDCKESNYQNPDWHQGETYSLRTITCSPVTLSLKPHDKTAVA
ncbi:hypothetical protein NUW58_g6958 [Xylaria curta]|uniref:Uncharacterized protein n=1 Tax=Xylaria curta TaxID=42375 RepID=A0ACC1NN89_9PEZI|nr:hypothetical protein NUW58_g6958 [Xylaria curta]